MMEPLSLWWCHGELFVFGFWPVDRCTGSAAVVHMLSYLYERSFSIGVGGIWNLDTFQFFWKLKLTTTAASCYCCCWILIGFPILDFRKINQQQLIAWCSNACFRPRLGPGFAYQNWRGLGAESQRKYSSPFHESPSADIFCLLLVMSVSGATSSWNLEISHRAFPSSARSVPPDVHLQVRQGCAFTRLLFHIFSDHFAWFNKVFAANRRKSWK